MTSSHHAGGRSDEHADDDVLDDVITRADLDALVRLVDERCTTRDWSGLRRVRDRCRAAVLTGRQLWPAATLAEYRLALLAPAADAAAILDEEDSGRFALGPLTEVVAQHHTWHDLAPHLGASPRAALVAHERALRGEEIDPESTRHLPDVLEIPYALQSWEPEYQLAEYLDREARFPSPRPVPRPETTPFDLTLRGENEPAILDPDQRAEVVDAVRELVRPWTASSNGRAEVIGVTGEPGAALRALGVRSAHLTALPAAEALAWLGWAGASGGAHGQRRGAASGRFATWWVLAAIGGLCDQWPVAPDELGTVAHEIRWWWWDAGEPDTGWRLQLVADDPVDGVSWAITAHDDA